MAPIRLSPETELPLLRARVSEIADYALVVGDPERAKAVSELLDDAVQVGANREYMTYNGTYQGVPVTVASHGVGAAGAAVCFEELARAGAKRIIRSGTAGGIQPEVTDGAIVVATGAVRAEGVTSQMVPLEFPAVATPEIVIALRDAVKNEGQDPYTGIVLTSDLFYPSDVIVGVDHKLWQRAGVVAVEMEAAALFTVAALHGIEAGAAFAVDGNPVASEDDDMSDYSPHRDIVKTTVERTFRAALSALIS
ncbi:MAG: nucleoside phosphorylase [Leucobacter sp.]